MAVGQLYLIPVSLGDSPFERYAPQYNLEVMRKLTTYIVENARTARQYIKKVMPSADISKLQVLEIDKHNGYAYPEILFEILHSGIDVGLMSEAGCPAVADPGHIIVSRAHREGIRVVPLIGPSSIILSLMASGFNGQNFTFHGYLPIDESSRRKALMMMERMVRESSQTQIFIETPYRNDKFIIQLTKSLPPSLLLCVAVDLTTDREEVHTYTLKEWGQRMSKGFSIHKRPAIFLLNS